MSLKVFYAFLDFCQGLFKQLLVILTKLDQISFTAPKETTIIVNVIIKKQRMTPCPNLDRYVPHMAAN